MVTSTLINAAFLGTKLQEQFGVPFMPWCCGLEYMLKVFRVFFTMWTTCFHLNPMKHLNFMLHMMGGTLRSKSACSNCSMRLGSHMRRRNRNSDMNSPLLDYRSA